MRLELISRPELDVIRRVPLFSSLDEEKLQDISAGADTRRFRRGETIVMHGQKSGALFVLLNGRARVVTADTRGREVILAVLGPGQYAGEMGLIDDKPHSATVRAEVRTDVLIVDAAEVARFLPGPESLAYGVMAGLVNRLRKANVQIESLALLDVKGRVARSLLDMSEVVNATRVIRRRVSRLDLAKVVGASREGVSRALSDLEARGFLETQATGWLVLKRESI